MRIRVMSDFHIEFFDFEPIEVPADGVALAGEILTEHHGANLGAQSVLTIAGRVRDGQP